MEILLKEDILKLGKKGELIKVTNGYARNYLIPQGMAVFATESAKKVFLENQKQQAHKMVKIREAAENIAEKIKDQIIRIGAKASSTGKIFGSISNIQIADKISEMGFNIDRRNIKIEGEEDHVKELGNYKAKVMLDKDIVVDLNFEVFAE